ncbi:alginate export family protein [Bremerella sp. P1]|uniref:alginate export family protein n=1 Tax=Bremerella sp. P1 TaxID=3026424 RepID=UPI0023676AF6|nr:alginate export family protein [Bremerella sp. P1]WDI41505.1 alginate export family protein [Bremerella sp. P1]
MRYNEDWSFLESTDLPQGQWWVPLKYISTASGYVTTGTELRARYEKLENANWGMNAGDRDGYLWLRALPTLDWHPMQNTRFFGELIVAPAVDVEPMPSPIDEDISDILQAFVDIELDSEDVWRFRLGRQLTEFGSGRLISTRYGTNVLRSFDTIELRQIRDQSQTFIFYGRPVRAEVGAFDDQWSRTQQLWSLYATIDLIECTDDASESVGVDLYYIGSENTQAVFDEGTGRELRHTFGTRLYGTWNSWSWNPELFIQLGEFGEKRIEAWSLAMQIGYQMHDLVFEPGFDLKVDFISGDTDPNDAKLGTFNPLYPKLKYFGESGVIAPYNLIDIHPSLSLDLSPQVNLTFDVDFLWRYSRDDALYGAGGSILRPSSASSSRYVTTQYEGILEVVFTDNLAGTASYTLMPPGAFIQESGEAETMHFFGCELLYIY